MPARRPAMRAIFPDMGAQIRREVRQMQLDAADTIHAAMDRVGEQAVEFLRATTGELRPPVVPGGVPRPAHPGHWADITGLLASMYQWDVVRDARSITLLLTNDAPYAVMLDRMFGFYVLTGVADPGGPVDRILARVITDLVPGVTYEFGLAGAL